MTDRFDVLVIGAGVAGMSVVHSLYEQAPQLRVGLITLQAPGEAGATPWAQGGVAVAWGGTTATGTVSRLKPLW